MKIRDMSKEEIVSYLKNLIPSYDLAVLIPQCLRSDYCQAETNEGVVQCVGCARQRKDGEKCWVGGMKEAALALKKQGIEIKFFILKGISTLARLLVKEGKPKKVLGIACSTELEEGNRLMSKIGVQSKTLHLLKEGCSETLVNLDLYKEILRNYVAEIRKA
ncbi:DUF116 domain-containing protein [Candidatus Woesearchaeota archaeon]|nr:DUF116 domain-containing protein [Candidatus Woesearchaeota archaeon]